MAISSKDLESLWQRYKAEAVPAGISVNQFFESNGVIMYLKSGTRRSSRLQMLWSVLLQVRQIQPVQFQHHPNRVILQPVYLQLRPRMPLSLSMSILGFAMV